MHTETSLQRISMNGEGFLQICYFFIKNFLWFSQVNFVEVFQASIDLISTVFLRTNGKGLLMIKETVNRFNPIVIGKSFCYIFRALLRENNRVTVVMLTLFGSQDKTDKPEPSTLSKHSYTIWKAKHRYSIKVNHL